MELLKAMRAKREALGLDPEPKPFAKMTKKEIEKEKPKKAVSLRQQRMDIIEKKPKLKEVSAYFEAVISKFCVESSSDEEDD